jgi:hypothetical protein
MGGKAKDAVEEAEDGAEETNPVQARAVIASAQAVVTRCPTKPVSVVSI